MTKVFYDTEFIEDGSTIDLISIGLVREDGEEYYAVSKEFCEPTLRARPWLVENVLPHLPLNSNGWLDLNHADVKSRKQIAAEVGAFLLSTPDLSLWAWYGAYDHVALAQLWGPMRDMPEGIPFWTGDLKQRHVDLGSPELPKQEGGEHNALADARWNHLIDRFLDDFEPGAS